MYKSYVIKLENKTKENIEIKNLKVEIFNWDKEVMNLQDNFEYLERILDNWTKIIKIEVCINKSFELAMNSVVKY